MLVEITPQSHHVVLDLRYATADNFTGTPVYQPSARCFLHQDAAEKLTIAADLARIQGFGLRIFDAFRPAEAQQKLWNHTPDPEFLSPPERGSPHSRGVAVDLTLIDPNGHDLDMGTAFDAFTPLSHHANRDISPEAQRNRFLLLGIMSAAGWDFYKNEWWHYQLFNSRSYPVLTDAEFDTRVMAA
jgi:D-alanyl-D-alanine dipeptidase